MGFRLPQLGRITRPPLVIFIALVLGSCLVTGGVIQLTLSSHLNGDYILLENEYMKIKFPKNWYAASWKDINVTVGNKYGIMVAPTDLFATVVFRLYDEQAAQNFMKENNLTDTFSAVIFKANQLYNWSLQSNGNATLFFVENGTKTVSGYRADYVKVFIKGGYVETADDGTTTTHNVTGIFLSCMNRQSLLEILFWGIEDDWGRTYGTFEVMLNSIKI